MSQNRDLIVGTFTGAVWLVAKGFIPHAATLNPERRRIEYRFPPEARESWVHFSAAKFHLEKISRQARGQA